MKPSLMRKRDAKAAQAASGHKMKETGDHYKSKKGAGDILKAG